MRMPIVPLAAAVFVLGSWAPARAQESPEWRLSTGGGLGLVLAGHDMQESGAPGLAIRVAALRGDANRAWGLEWMGNWLEGAPGGDHRHHFGVTFVAAPGGGPIRLRAGVGLALVTVAEVDQPPRDGPPGDTVIGIGDYGTVGATAGVETSFSLARGLRLQPAADVLLQRAGGYTLALAVLTLRLETTVSSGP